MKKELLKVAALVAITISSMQNAFSQTWNLAGNADATTTSLLGTTNSVSLRLATKNTPRLIIDTLGRVGIGITIPTTQLMVRGSGGNPVSTWTNIGKPVFGGFGETNVGNADFILGMASSTFFNATPRFAGRRSRGALNAPAAVTLGDQLMSFSAFGYDGTAFQNPAEIAFTVDAAPAGTAVPANISFATGNNGVSRVERMRITSAGNVAVTTGNLDVSAGNVGVAAGSLNVTTGNIGLGSGSVNVNAGNLNVAAGNLNLTAGNANVGGNLNMTSDVKTIQFANPTANSTGMMTMFNSGTQNADRMVIQHSSSYPNWGLQYHDSTDQFNFLGQGNTVMSVNLYPGSVGIGTATPGAKFDIKGSNTYDLSGSYPDFRLGDASYNLKMGVANAGSGAGDAYISGSNRLNLGTSNSFAKTQTMSINSDGQVGIGTTTPTAKLQIVGDTGTTATTLSVNPSYVGNAYTTGIYSYTIPNPGYGYGIRSYGGYIGGYFYANGGANTSTAYGVYGYASGTAGTRYGVYGYATGGTENWGGYFPAKTYASELRVGGTQGATGYVAAINGKLIATEVRVDLIANWPDYVFSSNHTLLSLEDLEASINTNKHLPGIPTAEEVKTGGIMLGEMQTKQMEKIEELTLYLIEIAKQNKELGKENKELRTRIEKLEKK